MPPHPGNLSAAKHGIYAERCEEEAQLVFETIMEAPHTVPLDAVGARRIAELEVFTRSVRTTGTPWY